jgi:hypothetical protein
MTLALLLLMGCQGVIGDADPIDPMPDPRDPTMPVLPGEPWVAAAPIARLTADEIANTLDDLYGVVEDAPREIGAEGGSIAAYGPVEAIAAFQRAQAVVAEIALDPCAGDRAACTDDLVRTEGRRIFRRPLTEDEVGRYAAAANAASTYEEGARVVLGAMLASPHFLYRAERGDPSRAEGALLPLTDHEVASRLSYALWDSMPDETLLSAADAGELRTPEQIDTQARRMLEHPRARAVVVGFHRYWLGAAETEHVFRDAIEYPAFDEALPSAWIEETDRFVEHVVFEGPGTLAELMTASYTFAPVDAAAIYDAVPDADGRVELPPGQRAGLLTQSTLLATRAPDERVSALYRGAFIYRKVLCAPLPSPPRDIPPLPEADPSASLREQIETMTSVTPCVTCHQSFNDLGFALGHYDALGAYRDTDANDRPVDARVELASPGDLEGVSVDGAVELAQALADSEALRDCYVDTWFRYLAGRPLERTEEANTRTSLQTDFEETDRNVRDLLVALVTSDAFRYLPPPE